MSKVFTITEGLENMGALKTGGQGSVYKARRIGPIITAVKLLPTPIHSESEQDKHYRDFQNEVAKLKRVSEQPNPNIVKILSSGITESGALPFIEMEFIEGPDLEELLQPPHPPVFTIKEVIKVAEHLSNALAHCHRLGISHGDIKSNNVKFNLHTGNYVLLDFGLAIMSDEQRRTSLRHAGAIEFMAPEQNEGRMLPQTDVYSFGVILYELIAGRVPFPLTDRSETARHTVRLQHMEAPVPDALELRGQHLPADWPEARREREQQVPQWLLDMVGRCLEKQPERRFENGAALLEFVTLHSTQLGKTALPVSAAPVALQQENEQLRREKADLQRRLNEQGAQAQAGEQELLNLRVALTRKERELQAALAKAPTTNPGATATQPPPRNAYDAAPPRRRRGMRLPMILAGIFVGGALLYLIVDNQFSEKTAAPEKKQVATETRTEKVAEPKPVLGEYKVVAERAYFHNEPDEATRRGAYMIPSEEVIKVLEEQNGFFYTEFTNSRGQTSKGWLLKADLMPLSEWNTRQAENVTLTQAEIADRLDEARRQAGQRNIAAAITIYRQLSAQEVPEAMFEFGNRALKGEHESIDCDAAYNLVTKAAERDYAPAKRTLGFLYLFGKNREVLRMSKYNRCSFDRDIVKGTRLLMEAVAAGDSSANEILTDFNREQATDSTQ